MKENGDEKGTQNKNEWRGDIRQIDHEEQTKDEWMKWIRNKKEWMKKI